MSNQLKQGKGQRCVYLDRLRHTSRENLSRVFAKLDFHELPEVWQIASIRVANSSHPLQLSSDVCRRNSAVQVQKALLQENVYNSVTPENVFVIAMNDVEVKVLKVISDATYEKQ